MFFVCSAQDQRLLNDRSETLKLVPYLARRICSDAADCSVDAITCIRSDCEIRVSLSSVAEDSRLMACDCLSLDSTAFIFRVKQSLLGLFLS